MRLRIASCLGFVSLGVVPFEVAADPVPTRAQAALEAGHAHYAANELERAVAQYEAALQLAPDLSEAWFFKARSHGPEAYCRLASIYWDEAFRNSLLTDPEADGLADRGLAVAELGARQPDHRECLVYKAQLLRVKAQRAPTEELRLRYRNEAQQVQRAAVEAMRRQRAEKP